MYGCGRARTNCSNMGCQGLGDARLQRCSSVFGGMDLRAMTSASRRGDGEATVSVTAFLSQLYISTAEYQPEECTETDHIYMCIRAPTQ